MTKLPNLVAFLYTTIMNIQNLKRYMPSKMVLIVLGLLVLGFLSYGAFYLYQKSRGLTVDGENFVQVSLVDDIENKDRFLDSDNDGAYDWVERLWPELDPFNPDSDGDGVLDGKYIRQKQLIRDRERFASNEVFEELTASQQLGRSIYSALYAIEQSGGTIDEQTQDKIAENVMNYVSDLSLGSKTYLRDELTLVENTKTNSYSYRDAMKKFFEKNPIKTSEIMILINSLEKKEEMKPEIEKTAIKYNSYIKELSAMNVPYAIAGRHTQLINAAGQIEGALKNLVLEESDEVVILSSMIQIDKTLNTIVDASVHIEKYFDIISNEKNF